MTSEVATSMECSSSSAPASKMQAFAAKLGNEKIVHILSLTASGCIAIGGLAVFSSLGFAHIMNGVLTMLLGILLIVTELFRIPMINGSLPFLASFLGRGVVYIYVGFNIMSSWGVLTAITGIVATLIGAAFVTMHFVNKGRISFPATLFNREVKLPAYLTVASSAEEDMEKQALNVNLSEAQLSSQQTLVTVPAATSSPSSSLSVPAGGPTYVFVQPPQQQQGQAPQYVQAPAGYYGSMPQNVMYVPQYQPQAPVQPQQQQPQLNQ